MILLIGSGNDPHILSIKEQISYLGGESCILDTDKNSLLNTEFSYCSNSHSISVLQNKFEFCASDISAVFCLSPMHSRKGFVSSNEKDFWFFTWKESLYGLYQELANRTFFINKNIFNAIPAQNKITFFQAANEAGINTPDTWIGNNKDKLLSFFDKHQQVVLKTMHQIYLEYNQQSAMMLVKKVSQQDFLAFNSDNECPVFLQQAINKMYDVRAIVVGRKIMGCKIDASNSLLGSVDWRAYDLPNTIHSKFDLPDYVQKQLLMVMDYLKLDYACLDLCVDKQGVFWLLDVNPFGRYKWIELGVNLEISFEIASLLMKNSQCDVLN